MNPPEDPPNPPPTPPPPAPADGRVYCPGPPDKPSVKCTYRLKKGERYCYNHDPARADERRANGAKRRRPGDLGGELGTLDGIARRAAKVLEQLEQGVVLDELLDLEVSDKVRARIKRDLGKVLGLEPARANSMLAALRFLAQLVQLRTAVKGKRGAGEAIAAGPFDLEAALG